MDGSNINTAYNVTAAELRQFIERIETLDAEKREISGQIKEVYDEAKGRGYLIMAIRRIVKERAADPEALAEAEAVLALYRAALGME